MFLAVEKSVSASSQNQAFNSLLFLYRNVLKEECGDMKAVGFSAQKAYKMAYGDENTTFEPMNL